MLARRPVRPLAGSTGGLPELRVVATRRAALMGTLAASGLVAVTGCDDVSAPAGTTGAAPPDPAGDQALVEATVAAIARTGATVAAARQAHPALRSRLQPLAALHRSHLRVLDATVADASATVPARLGRRDASAVVRRAETALQQHLARTALRVASGELARVLASMSASVAQHLAVRDLDASSRS